MKRFLGLAMLVVIGVAVWRIGGQLSADALGMAIGVVFGVLAGIPTALLVLATGRRQDAARAEAESERRRQDRYLPAPYGGYQPPVIVLAGGQTPVQAQNPPAYAPYGRGEMPAWDSAGQRRQFKLVGEQEELLD